MPRIKKKILLITLSLCSVALGTYLILYSLSDSIVFFYAPSELDKIHQQQDLRVGGLVAKGRVKYLSKGVEFIVTDYKSDLLVIYNGLIPSLFRENQGVVVRGYLDITNKIFYAEELLIKHDEKYKPLK